MAKIRIIAVPPGQAPEWVRQAWVGLELPVVECKDEGIQFGVGGGKPENLGGYHVKTTAAISLLKQVNRSAAEYWTSNINPYAVDHLVFKKEVCELLE